MEIWKDIEGYSGKYQVSNQGNVRSFSRWSNGKILKGGKCGNPGPYRFVALVGEGRKDIKNCYIHRLVAEAFLENPNNYSEVNHKDGNTLNNAVDNLEWCTHYHNMHHALENGLIDRTLQRGKLNSHAKPIIQKALTGEIVKEWDCAYDAQREKGYLASSISSCCTHRKHYKTAYGFIWEYKNGETDD